MILVTGGTGLVGSHLLFELATNDQRVRAIFRNKENISLTQRLFNALGDPEAFARIEWIQADICDTPSLEDAFLGITHVYHCAALISFDPKDEEKLRKTNIEGTANIVNFSLAYGVEKLCFVSSTAAIGDLREGETQLTEESEWNPEKLHNDYSISKYGAEMDIWRGRQEGLRVAILNPGVILGPGFWHTGSGKLFEIVGKGISFFTEGQTGFVSAADTAKLLHKLMKSDISGQRFIAVSENLTFKKVVGSIADALKVKRPSRRASKWMTSIAWRLDWLYAGLTGKRRKLTKDDARSLHSVTNYSNLKVISEFGFDFEPIESAIENAVATQRIIQRAERQDPLHRA